MTTSTRANLAGRPPADALRIPPIAADLLPPEVIEARRVRKVRRNTVVALVAIVCLLAVWQLVASRGAAAAHDRLTSAQEQLNDLQRRQGTYTELTRTQNESNLIRSRLTVLLANDVRWSRILSSLRDSAPAGVSVTGVTAALNGTAASGGTAGAGSGAEGSGSGGGGLPSTSGRKQIGTLTVTGTGHDNRAIAAYVDALERVQGLANPLLTGTTWDKGTLKFTVGADITDAALSGRYSVGGTESTGGH